MIKVRTDTTEKCPDQHDHPCINPVSLILQLSIMSMKNALSWFEIPVTNMDRAQKFYETILEVKLIPMDMPNLQMRMFPIDDPMTGIGGALCFSPGFYQSSATDGPLIYLNGNPDLQIILDRVVPAGGTIVVPKKAISPEHGHMAIFTDPEGNRMALHSVPEKG
jgi:hypothetical protein